MMFQMATDHFNLALKQYNEISGSNIASLLPQQIESLKNIVDGYDLLVVLPTGYGKSLIFEMIPFVAV